MVPGSQPEFDGSRLASKGVVVVTINYRLDVFGFLAHPELTKESGTNSSGNYGLLDQIRAQVGAEEYTGIRWRPQSGNAVRGVGGRVRQLLHSLSPQELYSLTGSVLSGNADHAPRLSAFGGKADIACDFTERPGLEGYRSPF